jgi:hypothetical protein
MRLGLVSSKYATNKRCSHYLGHQVLVLNALERYCLSSSDSRLLKLDSINSVLIPPHIGLSNMLLTFIMAFTIRKTIEQAALKLTVRLII